MANTIEYAQLFQTGLDKKMLQGSATGVLEINPLQVKYNGGNTVRIPKMAMSGLGNYSRENGYGDNGAVSLSFETHTFDMDRSKPFLIDAMDVDESNFVATVGNAMAVFQDEQVIPETDSYRLSKICTVAKANDKVNFYTPAEATIFKTLTDDIASVKNLVGADKKLIIFMSIPTMTVLNNCDQISKRLDVGQYTKGEINTEVKKLNGIPIFEVSDDRMKTVYTFGADGYSEVAGALSINWIIVVDNTLVGISKTDKIKIITPEVNQDADAWKLAYRKYHTLIIPDNTVRGIYVNITPAIAVVSPSFTLTALQDTATTTLTGGKFKSSISLSDFTIAGTDKATLEAGTLARVSDTVATITFTAGATGTDNVITVKGSAQELQVTSVAVAGSTA